MISAMETKAKQMGKHFARPLPTSNKGLTHEDRMTKEAKVKARLKAITPTLKLLRGQIDELQREQDILYKELYQLQQERIPIQLVTKATKTERDKALRSIAAMSPEEIEALLQEVRENES